MDGMDDLAGRHGRLEWVRQRDEGDGSDRSMLRVLQVAPLAALGFVDEAASAPAAAGRFAGIVGRTMQVCAFLYCVGVCRQAISDGGGCIAAH